VDADQLRMAAATDQVLATLRDVRGEHPSPALDHVIGELAKVMRMQFPDTPGLGRVLVGTYQALHAARTLLAASGTPVSSTALFALLPMIGHELDRQESKDDGRG